MPRDLFVVFREGDGFDDCGDVYAIYETEAEADVEAARLNGPIFTGELETIGRRSENFTVQKWTTNVGPSNETDGRCRVVLGRTGKILDASWEYAIDPSEAVCYDYRVILGRSRDLTRPEEFERSVLYIGLGVSPEMSLQDARDLFKRESPKYE